MSLLGVPIIVVDNASRTDVAEITSSFDSVKLIRLHRNLGCPVARNIAIANAETKYVYCLDDDGWLDEGAIESSVQLAMQRKVDCVVSRIITPEGEDLGLTGEARVVNRFNGGATLFSTDLFSKVGFFPHYKRQMEETYISLIMYDREIPIFFNPSSVMFHEKVKKLGEEKNEYFLNVVNSMKNAKSLLSPFASRAIITVLLFKFFVRLKYLSLAPKLIAGYIDLMVKKESDVASHRISLRNFRGFHD